MRFGNVAKVTVITFCVRFHLYIHVYALYLQRHGWSLLQISTIESLVIATRFAAEVPTGLIADRLGRKWSVVASSLFLMSGETLFFFRRDYGTVLIIAVLTGLGFALGSGATEALVYDSLTEPNRASAMRRAMGSIGAVGQIAFFLAPIVGSIIVGNLEPERFAIAILVTVLSLLVAVLVSLALVESAIHRPEEIPGTLTILRLGLAEVRHNQQLRQVLFFTVFTTAFGGTLITTLAGPYLVQRDVSLAMVAMALSIGSLLAAAAQSNAYRLEQHWGTRRALVVLAVLPGLLYWLLAIITGPILAWLVITLQYGVDDMKVPLLSAYQNQAISSESRATVLSMISMVLNMFIAVMGPLYATLAGISLPLAFLIMGTVIVVASWRLRVGT